MSEFINVYNCLETQYDYFNDSLDTIYPGYTFDQYSDLLDSLGIDEDDPFRDFETTLGHKSLRAIYENNENSWLVSGGLGSPPYEEVDDDVLATILDENGMMIIGDTLFYLAPDGRIFLSYPYDCNDIKPLLDNPDEAVESNSRHSLWVPNPSGDCKARGIRDTTIYFDHGDKKAYQLATWKNYPWGVVIKGKMKTYKSKASGGWKKRRYQLEVLGFGYTYDISCTESEYYDFWKNKRSKKIIKKKGFYSNRTYIEDVPSVRFQINYNGNFPDFVIDTLLIHN